MKGTRQSGFSMIELLVAVLVMGIGVLGVTGLQVMSLKNNKVAMQRAEAVQLAYDMMDRIRANPSGTPPGNDYAGVAIGSGPPALGTDCTAADCTAADMVTFDVASWKCSLGSYSGDATCATLRGDGVIPPTNMQRGLPQGDGKISISGDVITIEVQWKERDAAGTTYIQVSSRV